MTTTKDYAKGDSIRYRGNLGAMESASGTRFVAVVESGDEGVYLGPHAGKLGREGWHMTQTVTDPALFVPVHVSQIEPALPGGAR